VRRRRGVHGLRLGNALNQLLGDHDARELQAACTTGRPMVDACTVGEIANPGQRLPRDLRQIRRTGGSGETMTDPDIRLQVLYEIAMSIGNGLNLKKMLQASLPTYLKKLNFTAGAVFRGEVEEKTIGLEPVLAIPRGIEKYKAFQAAFSNIPQRIPRDRLEEHLQRLPLTGKHGNSCYHIMELKNFGLLIFLKSREPLDGDMIESLLPLNEKLANACRACLRNDHIQKMASDLRQENSERLKAEKALKASQERLVTILNSMDVLVYVVDIMTHELIFMNRPMESLFGEHSLGRPCFEMLRGASAACPNCANESLLDAQGQPIGIIVWEDRNPITRRWYIHQARAIRWIDDRTVRLQISTDITDLKKMELERVIDAHLQQTRRLEALGILAGGIAHEFNNLLMSMLGNLSLIKFKIENNHVISRHLDKIEASVQSAAGLTDQLLGYAQKGRYENIRLQLNTLIRALCGPFIQKYDSIRVHMDLSIHLHPIEADQRQIEHVLSNLLSNAADAMPEGGDLFIQTANMKRADIKDKPYKLPMEAYVELRFSDTGKGMTPEIRERIFDPFYSTKPMTAGKGAGLGMAATYGIIKSHNGFIEVNSAPGQGSEFMIYLPAIGDPGDQTGPGDNATQACRTILLIDDEKLALEIGTQILEHLGYQVIQAGGGVAAVEYYEKYHEKIDLVILDMVMPEMTGIETFEQIKSGFPEARILLASGYLVDAEAQRLLEYGADGFVKKPFAVEELYKAIEKAFCK
jgi:signal transduction histidine kinase